MSSICFSAIPSLLVTFSRFLLLFMPPLSRIHLIQLSPIFSFIVLSLFVLVKYNGGSDNNFSLWDIFLCRLGRIFTFAPFMVYTGIQIGGLKCLLD